MKNDINLWRNNERGNLTPFFGRNDNRPLIQRLDRLFDSMFDDVLSPFGAFANSDKFIPAVEVLEQKDCYVFHVDLPGVKREDVEVEMRGNRLLVSGERRQTLSSSEGASRYVERRFGRFSRSFTLPENIDIDRAEGEFHEGVLKISIPKTESLKSTRVTIHDRSAS